MRCKQAMRMVSRSRDAVLSGEELALLDGHLAACGRCRHVAERLELAGQILGSLAKPDPVLGVAGKAFLAHIRGEEPRRASEFRLARALGAVAMLLLLVGGWRVTNGRAVPERAGPGLAERAEGPALPFSPTVASRGAGALHPSAPSSRTRKEGEIGSRLAESAQAGFGGPQSIHRQALSRDDLGYLNGGMDKAPEAELAPSVESAYLRSRTDSFVWIARPRLASVTPGALAEAAAQQDREASAIDERLAKTVSLGLKAVSFEDLCKRLTEETGVEIAAGRTVQDDKVTVFCRRRALRELMRAVTGLFRYGWVRTGKPGAFRYELVQDLRSQLEEEALRNRDRDEALLALDREMAKYRPYLGLSSAELKERAKAAGSPEEREMLQKLAGPGWAGANLYFGLSGNELAALRSGQGLRFQAGEGQGGLARSALEGAGRTEGGMTLQLPPGMGAGILAGLDHMRVDASQGGVRIGPASALPNGQAPSSLSGASPTGSLRIDRSELGQYTLHGGMGFDYSSGGSTAAMQMAEDLGTGLSPSVSSPNNARANSALAKDTAFKRKLAIRTKASCVLEEEAQDDPPEPGEAAPGPGQRELQVERRRTAPSPRDGEPAQAGPRATTADLLEAVHEATGRDVIGDYFTRLYRPEQLTTLGTTLFAGLNKVSGEARLNWRASEGWITFRTASFFNDRLKEIPARHLDRWAKARKESGWLTPEALAEIASLADSQIESRHISDGAVAVHGLKEWRLVQGTLLPAWRLLATLPKSSRSVVTAEGGLRLGGVGGEAWKRFLELCFGSRGMDRGIGLLPADCSLLLVYETREGKRPLAEFRMSALLPDGELWETKVAPGSMSRGSRRM